MARSAAGKAELAADALEAFLRDRPRAAPGNPDNHAVPAERAAEKGARGGSLAAPARAGEGRGGPARRPAAAPLRLPHTDWLQHRLVASGPVAEMDTFRSAASGPGTIPWRLDLDSLEEDWFHLLVNPASRSLSLAGARVLAGQLCEAVGRRHAVAVTRVGHSRACPFEPARPPAGAGRHSPSRPRSSRCPCLALAALGHHRTPSPCGAGPCRQTLARR